MAAFLAFVNADRQKASLHTFKACPEMSGQACRRTRQATGPTSHVLARQGSHTCPVSSNAETHLIHLVPDIVKQLFIIPIMPVYEGGYALSGEKPTVAQLW